MSIPERAQAVGMIRAGTLTDMYVTHRYNSCTMFNYLLLSAKKMTETCFFYQSKWV